MRRSFRTTSILFVTLALAAGCTLVNSLDDVKPADDGRFTGETRQPPVATFEDAGFGPSNQTADAATEAATGEEFSPLVVGGAVPVGDAGELGPVLTVLDSKSGRERSARETMWVAGIAHDDLRDVWFIFEAKNYLVATPTETVKLHIRRLDLKSGAWTELSAVDVPPLLYYDAIAVTSERISYVAHPIVPDAAAAKNRLVTLNVSDLAAPIVSSDLVELAELPRGITGTPSKAGTGGNINIINVATGADCEALDGGTRCKVKVRRYQLPNGATTPTPGLESLVGGMANTGVPGYGSVSCKGAPDDIVVMPGVANAGQGDGTPTGTQTWATFGYLNGSGLKSGTFRMETDQGAPTQLRKVAVDNPRRIIFVIEANNDTQLYAVPLDLASDKGDQLNLGHSGQSVYYDPASETAFAPFNQGLGKTFSAIKVVGGKGGGAVSLAERQPRDNGGDWDPPSDLRPNILGIRLTGQAACQ